MPEHHSASQPADDTLPSVQLSLETSCLSQMITIKHAAQLYVSKTSACHLPTQKNILLNNCDLLVGCECWLAHMLLGETNDRPETTWGNVLPKEYTSLCQGKLCVRLCCEAKPDHQFKCWQRQNLSHQKRLEREKQKLSSSANAKPDGLDWWDWYYCQWINSSHGIIV